MSSKRCLLLLRIGPLVLTLTLLMPVAGARSAAGGEKGSVYRRVYRELTKHPNRLPGGPGYEAGLRVLEQVLRAAGLRPHRQRFNTLVPRTRRCVLTVDGKDVGPVYPLAPNTMVPPSTGPGPVNGPLVYVGRGTPREIAKKPLAGGIALLDLGSRRMHYLFEQGVRAVILVGDAAATQWQAAAHFSSLPAMVPRAYMERETARRHGLLRPGHYPRASLRINVTWRSVRGSNLWTEIPGRPGSVFSLGTEEAICLSAVLDTFGIVPELCPGKRRAANVSLLAELTCALARDKPRRSIFVVFLGSHYAAQEGARNFFYAVDKARLDSRNKDPLPQREGFYRAELEQLRKQLDLLARPGFLRQSDHPQFFAVVRLLRRLLTKRVNAINYELQELAFRRSRAPEAEDYDARDYDWRQEKRVWNDLRRQLSQRRIDPDQPAYTVDDVLDWRRLGLALRAWGRTGKKALRARLWRALPSALRARLGSGGGIGIARHESTVAALNRLLADPRLARAARGDPRIRNLPAGTSASSPASRRMLARLLLDRLLGRAVNRGVRWRWRFARLVADLRRDLGQRRSEMQAMLGNNLDAQELAARLQVRSAGGKVDAKRVVAYFDFDFARDDAPWLMNAVGDRGGMLENSANTGDFLGNLRALCKVWQSLPAATRRPPLLVSALDGAYTPASLSFPLPRGVPCTAAHNIGVYGYELVTAGDRCDQDELPSEQDRDLRGLTPVLVAFTRALADSPELSLGSTITPATPNRKLMPLRQDNVWRGYKFEYTAKGSNEAEAPAAGAIVGMLSPAFDRVPQVGYCRVPFARVNGAGYVFMPRVVGRWEAMLRGIGFDRDGLVERISSSHKQFQVLFYARGGTLMRPLGLTSYDAPAAPKVLDARNDSRFSQVATFSRPDHDVVFFDRNVDFKCIGNGVLLLGGIPQKPAGLGIAPDQVALPALPVAPRAARDYVLLNQERLEALRRRSIVNDSLERLHAEAASHLEQAEIARKAGDTAKAYGHAVFSLCLGFRTYDPLRLIADDMVSSVVILMLLTIPFAFFMERLLFGFTTIYRQILGFAGVFLATFAVLYLVHPAFSLADAPIMIFLAFIIILLSSLVIYVVMGKFRYEIRALQGLVSKVHAVQAESSTALASVVIGISGMRNRPLKTLLTATTIVLLTFTILVFSSFTSKLGVLETFLGKGRAEPRVEVHRQSFLDIPRPLVDSITAVYGEHCEVFPRAACFADPFQQRNLGQPREFVAYNPANSRTTVLASMIGLAAGELARNRRLREIVPAFAREAARPGPPPLFLAELANRDLGLQPGDRVTVAGKRFRFAGTFDAARLQDYTNIDGTRMLCPDYKATLQDNDINSRMGGEQLENALEEIDTSNFIWCPPALTAISTYNAVRDQVGVTNAITLYPRGEVDLSKVSRAISRIFRGPVYVQSATGAEKMFFTRTVEGAGISEIIVPLLLGGLIIFSSLLGSIVDREREIFTYSALGLSPPDVAALFFAESSVYAVIGGLGGYLLSQVVAKLMNLLAAYGLFTPPEMNFSSLSSIYTILVVMATVILSTIYPALKAGRSANPGVARRWRMPAPEGDRLRFVFPFTVSSADLLGVLGFIREHFDAHRDASLGMFAARDVGIFRRLAGGRESLGIRAVLSLAPFDLGVFQAFELCSRPSDIAGIEEVVIELKRLSGSPAVWVRSNRSFIDELRNQFLLWRSLPVETMEHYRRGTREALQQAGD